MGKNISGQSSFYHISYEDLVSKTDEMIKNYGSYCGLKGEFSSEKRKSHYANTASQQQVSQDIYRTSLKKEEFTEYKDQFYSDLSQQDSFWQKLELSFKLIFVAKMQHLFKIIENFKNKIHILIGFSKFFTVFN